MFTVQQQLQDLADSSLCCGWNRTGCASVSMQYDSFPWNSQWTHSYYNNANIVSITGLTSLQSCSSIHPMLSVFIAWINLDFGIETCFYSGMDTYQKTWLQFAFPLYILLLIYRSYHISQSLLRPGNEGVWY